jgi:small-conductance mechanosensitive channel
VLTDLLDRLSFAQVDPNGDADAPSPQEVADVITDIAGQALVILAVLAVLLILRTLIVRYTVRSFEDPTIWYRVRKVANWTVFGLFLVSAVFIFTLEGAGLASIVTYLGILSAGVAVALSDLLRNLAGFIYVTARRPFKVGDRIEIDGHAGDVVDLRAFRFSLLEIRNWVEADQSTGRIIHIPCGKVLSEPIANFGAGFQWIWHEVPVLLTFESDWHRGVEVLERVLAEESPDVRSREAAEAIRRASKEYLLSFTHLTPTVYLNVKDSGIELTGRVLCDVRSRRGVTHRIWSALLTEFEADPSLELAYPTVRAFFAEPLQVREQRAAAEGPDGAAPPAASPPVPQPPASPPPGPGG